MHERFSAHEIKDIKKQNPEIVVLTHPECPPEVIASSDFTGSTSGMSQYVKKNQPSKVMLVTECSMSDNVQVENPNVQFIKPCNLCPHMKTITLPKILDCLEKETNEILIPEVISRKARKAVERMVAVGRSHWIVIRNKKPSLNQRYIKKIVKNAMMEDLQPHGDVTTQLIKNKKKLKAKIISNQKGIIGGLNFAREAFKYSDKKINFKAKMKDGRKIGRASCRERV